jgi:hypothetical protein
MHGLKSTGTFFPSSERDPRISSFLELPACSPHVFLTFLLLLVGDVGENPGLTWTCGICNRQITKRQYSFLCNSLNSHWVHKIYTNILLHQYTNTSICHQYTPPIAPIGQIQYHHQYCKSFQTQPLHLNLLYLPLDTPPNNVTQSPLTPE